MTITVTPRQSVDITVRQTGDRISVAIVGGLPGARGADGDRASFTAVAGEALGGQRVVHIDSDGLAYLASPATAVAKRPVGLTAGAAIEGAEVQILTGDDIDEVSWAWAPGPVYLGASGVPTQTTPTADAVYMIGVSAGPKRLRITPQLIAQL